MYRLNTKIRLTMLCLSGFELYSRWVPLAKQHPLRKTVAKTSQSKNTNSERFPFNQNVPFEFSATSSNERNSISQNFPKFPKKRTTSRGIPKFSKKLSCHSTFLPKFLEFSVEWFAFRKLNSFRNVWKLFGKFLYQSRCFQILKVLIKWKAPYKSEIYFTISNP